MEAKSRLFSNKAETSRNEHKKVRGDKSRLKITRPLSTSISPVVLRRNSFRSKQYEQVRVHSLVQKKRKIIGTNKYGNNKNRWEDPEYKVTVCASLFFNLYKSLE